MKEYMRRVNLLRDNLKAKAATYHWHDPDTSFIEAALSRGDRRMGQVLEAVFRAGGKMDAWSEYFSLERWLQAFEAVGLDPYFYAARERAKGEIFPWSMIDLGVSEVHLYRQRDAAYQTMLMPDCSVSCTGCGADRLLEGGVCDVSRAI